MPQYRIHSILGFGLSLAFVLSGLSGCASLRAGQSGSERQLVLDRQWVRQTTEDDFLFYRRTNRMTPVFHGPLIIQGNAIDGIVAYQRNSGSEAWRLRVENGVEGGAALEGGRLYFGAGDGQFYCVNADTGQVIWTFPVNAETLSPPTVADNVVYFQSGADVAFALDASTGKQLWLYNRQAATNLSIRASTRPVVDGETVYAGFSDGFLVALNRQTGSMQWEKKLARGRRFNDVDSTPIIDGDLIYVSSYDGSLYAINKNNSEIQWQYDQGGYTPVTLGQETLFYASTSGLIAALEKASGRVIWSRQLVNGIGTRPVLYGGYLLYGESDGNLVVADSRSGSVLTHFAPGRGVLSAPAVEDRTGEVYFISNSANLYAMKLGFQRRSARLPWQREEF